MVAGGEGLKARIRMQISRGLDRRQERALITARLRRVADRSEDDLADLRRLAEGRQPRSWHL